MFGNKDKKQTDSEAINKMISNSLLGEVIKQRRHSNMRTGAFIVVIVSIAIFNWFKSDSLGSNGIKIPRGEDYISLVRIRGSIQPGAPASPEFMEPSLTKAFLDEKSKGVLLMINSPGGTAVQGKMLYDLITRLKNETGKKVVVFGEDVMTSGAYMASVAADTIYVTESTLTGSIGVIQQNYGYKEIAEKIGIESRIIQSGEFKHRLDPFSDLKPDDIEKMQGVMSIIHQNFIDLIISRRGQQIKADHNLLFSGDFWTGKEALEFGLVDGVGEVSSVIDSEFGVKHSLDYTDRKGVINGIGDMFTQMANSYLNELDLQGFINGGTSLPR